MVNHTECSNPLAIRCVQWEAGIHTDLWILPDQSAVYKLLIDQGIFNNQWLRTQDRVPAERDISFRFLLLTAYAGFELLMALINKRDQSDWDIENHGRNACDVVVTLLRSGSQNSVFSECAQPLSLIDRLGCG